MGILLFIVAIILFLPLTLLNMVVVVWKKRTFATLNGYFYQTAVDIDRFGNHNLRTLLNTTLITSEGYQFGDFRETISSVLGKNQVLDSLSITGKALVWILDKLDENHCRKSIRVFD